MLITNGKGSS
jgi:hypothetical protein